MSHPKSKNIDICPKCGGRYFKSLGKELCWNCRVPPKTFTCDRCNRVRLAGHPLCEECRQYDIENPERCNDCKKKLIEDDNEFYKDGLCFSCGINQRAEELGI